MRFLNFMYLDICIKYIDLSEGVTVLCVGEHYQPFFVLNTLGVLRFESKKKTNYYSFLFYTFSSVFFSLVHTSVCAHLL